MWATIIELKRISRASDLMHVDGASSDNIGLNDGRVTMAPFSAACIINFQSSECNASEGKTMSWKKGMNCCLWDEVTCDAKTGNELNLGGNDFNMFPVASQFDQLTGLTHLDISSSSFSGKIPLEISYLSKLSSLDLSDNYGLMFEGHVFETVVGNLTQLRHLLLSGVSMSSVEPTSFLNMSFYITTLIPEGNRLQGKFPEDVFQFSYLEKFHLNGFHCPYLKMFYPNGFQCPYPMKLFLNGSHCLYLEKFFYVEFHGLEINLPKTNWSGPLKSLELSSSHLQELPDSIGNLRSLEILDLSYTNLTGPIPATLANLAQLKRLDLSKNNLSGLLPIPVFNFTQVEYLDFSRNNLIGSLPSRVSGILRLHWLGLNENFLSERVLSWLFSFPSLEVFWLSNNKLTGTIDQSDKVGALELSKLEELDLSNNCLLSLTSASNVDYSLPFLWKLNLSSCNASEFLNFVRNLEGLTSLDLSYNRIRAIEADMFVKLKWLQILVLSHNRPLSLNNNNNIKSCPAPSFFLTIVFL
ncbi:hypothetical protein F3Y22_tig00110403pilonHSYRG00021 [Hibiscus syriacus]|uniref:Leucine-rich repeat-containing N-terminal plant-type domain-containing protein n=1 Tax=Hibiscus syriacus TaxID=106335 RepID=A0A6A3ARW9_HIBSY|nr:hypothetical protein F3Y22_tig00110403pilonHSYRG00021 [Hibiscus syriacus]